MGNWLSKSILIISATILLSACGAKVHNGGYGIREAEKKEIKQASTKEDLKEIIGTPSSTTIIGNTETWIYSGYRSEQTAFFKPDFTNYDIIVATFDQAGNIQNITMKDLSDKEFIEYSKKQTHFTGETELGFWEELFGNIGRFSPAGM